MKNDVKLIRRENVGLTVYNTDKWGRVDLVYSDVHSGWFAQRWSNNACTKIYKGRSPYRLISDLENDKATFNHVKWKVTDQLYNLKP